MFYYLVTIKPYDKWFRSSEELLDILEYVKFQVMRMKSDYPIGWEFDNHNQIHLHTICESKRSIHKEQYVFSHCSVNVKSFPESDTFRVISYCLKEGLTKSGADSLNLIYHKYYFS